MAQITVKSIIDLWPTRAALASDISVAGDVVTPDRVHKWAARGDIPARYWARIIDAGRARGADVTAEALVAAHAPAVTPSPEKDVA